MDTHVLGATDVCPTAALTTARMVANVTMTPGNVYLYNISNSQTVAGTLSLSADNLTVTFTPAAALAATTQYYLAVDNVTDEAGNVYGGIYSYFATGP